MHKRIWRPLLCLIALGVFAGLAWNTSHHQFPVIDQNAMQYEHMHQIRGVRMLMDFFTWLGGTFVVVTLTTLIVIGFWMIGRFKPDGAVILAAVGGGLALMESMKHFFPRPRAYHIYDHLGSSFPSGHVFFALTVYGLIAHWTTHDGPPRRRIRAWCYAIITALLIGWSRVYVGAHYPTDVLAGLAMAVPWLIGWLAVLTHFHGREPEATAQERHARYEAGRARIKEAALFMPNLIKLAARLLRDPRVPKSRKIGLALLAAYLASPIDLVPDFIPVLGVADDLILTAITLRWVVKAVPESVIREHWDGKTDIFSLLGAVRAGIRGLMSRA
ncbi:MAG: undecaprenyl-diphosphatase [Capsulimonas sp.]|nr:undecaprenyl-diphosphatase [Capsulimonas sp.]